MKHPIFKKFILFIILFSTIFVSKAQLRFPNGTELNLYTHINFLYPETEILFLTGKIFVSEYNWEKISDSIDGNWLVGSCFNGDCWNGLPSKGTFIKEFGFNDTTGFIRFHVETYDLNGKSVIRYKVENKNNPSDRAVLTFNIVFEKGTGIASMQNKTEAITVFQNSEDNSTRIRFNKTEPLLSCRIINMQGKTVLNLATDKTDFVIDKLSKGIYIIELKSVRSSYTQRFVKY